MLFFIHSLSLRVATSSIFLEELSQERGRGGLGCQVERHGGQENDKQVAEKCVHLQELPGNLINHRCGSPNFAYTHRLGGRGSLIKFATYTLKVGKVVWIPPGAAVPEHDDVVC